MGCSVEGPMHIASQTRMSNMLAIPSITSLFVNSESPPSQNASTLFSALTASVPGKSDLKFTDEWIPKANASADVFGTNFVERINGFWQVSSRSLSARYTCPSNCITCTTQKQHSFDRHLFQHMKKPTTDIGEVWRHGHAAWRHGGR